jgi:hypothetical protein
MNPSDLGLSEDEMGIQEKALYEDRPGPSGAWNFKLTHCRCWSASGPQLRDLAVAAISKRR